MKKTTYRKRKSPLIATTKRQYDKYISEGKKENVDFFALPGVLVEVEEQAGVQFAKELFDLMNTQTDSSLVKLTTARFLYMFCLVQSTGLGHTYENPIRVKDDKELLKIIRLHVKRDFASEEAFVEIKKMYSTLISMLLKERENKEKEEKKRLRKLKRIPREQRIIPLVTS